MKKRAWESKTIQGIVLAVVGALWGLWTGGNEISQTVLYAGLGWAGIGLRKALG